MCLSPITIRNRSKYVNVRSLHRLAFDVPCGQCAECKAARQNEYYFRSYYQALECWDNNGYCLFDTLTYDDAHVPHINDFLPEDMWFTNDSELENFTCFKMEDVRLFLVRLRRYLSYHGYDVKDKLRYFLCSEYGTDPRYTHRPHYHIMFYVMDHTLDPLILSAAIKKCWQNGRTDGVEDQGSGYVLDKRVFYRGADDLHMQNVCHYIGKYMVKDTDFEEVIQKRIHAVKVKLKAKHGHQLTEEDKKFMKDVKRHCSQFIRQSQHFGEYMIEKIGRDWIFEHNCVRMPDQENVWKEIPIPGYIAFKMFKEKKVDMFGETYYGWSDYGIKFRQYHEFESFEAKKKKFLETINYGNLLQWYDDKQIQKIHTKLNDLMAGRSVDDLFFYQQYVKDRLWIDDVEPDFESYYYIDQREMVDDESLNNGEVLAMLHHDLLNDYIYRDEKFDEVLKIYNRIKRRAGVLKQAAYDERIRLEKVFKATGLRY